MFVSRLKDDVVKGEHIVREGDSGGGVWRRWPGA